MGAVRNIARGVGASLVVPAAVETFEELSRFHGANERVSIENPDRAAEFYTRVIAMTAG